MKDSVYTGAVEGTVGRMIALTVTLLLLSEALGELPQWDFIMK